LGNYVRGGGYLKYLKIFKKKKKQDFSQTEHNFEKVAFQQNLLLRKS
jgi:hypothetical protein